MILPNLVGAAAATPTSAYTPVTPTRVADSKHSAATGGYTRVTPNQISVPIRNKAGVPANAVAVALIVTAASGPAAGYLTVWPWSTGAVAPVASLVNHAANESRCNMALVKIGDNNAVEVTHSLATTTVTVDVIGYFTPAATATAGRFMPVAPTLDRESARWLALHNFTLADEKYLKGGT